jgi:hypothetical protein
LGAPPFGGWGAARVWIGRLISYWFLVQGSRFKVQGLRFNVQSSRFQVQGFKFKVSSSRFQVQGLRMKVAFWLNPNLGIWDF